MIELAESPRWMQDAACANSDPELFFSETGWSNRTIRQARRICHTCPVEHQCLEWSYTAANGLPDRHSILGGMTPRERAWKRRRAA